MKTLTLGKDGIGQAKITLEISLTEQSVDLREVMREFQNEVIKAALEEFGGNRTHAARWLHMKRPGLVYHANRLRQKRPVEFKSVKPHRLK